MNTNPKTFFSSLESFVTIVNLTDSCFILYEEENYNFPVSTDMFDTQIIFHEFMNLNIVLQLQGWP